MPVGRPRQGDGGDPGDHGGARRTRLKAVDVFPYGVGKGDRVAVAAPNGKEHLLAYWATLSLAAVIGVPDRVLGQQVKAFVVPEPGAPRPAEDDLRAWVGEKLAAFKVPAFIEFRDALPYNETGKVLKRRLEDESGGS